MFATLQHHFESMAVIAKNLWVRINYTKGYRIPSRLQRCSQVKAHKEEGQYTMVCHSCKAPSGGLLKVS